MNTSFNTIETIMNTADNRSAAYLSACADFKTQAVQFSTNESFICRKYAEEVHRAVAKANNADCEYAIYAAAHMAEGWLAKAWNNAD